MAPISPRPLHRSGSPLPDHPAIEHAVSAKPVHDRLLQAADFSIALITLIVLSPLMLLLALLIWAADGQSPIYGHRRYGRYGRTFVCFKFRLMAPNAEAALARVLARSPAARAEWERDQKLRRDPRVTPIGRFLRKSSLDELPQLFNILRGEIVWSGRARSSPPRSRATAGASRIIARSGRASPASGRSAVATTPATVGASRWTASWRDACRRRSMRASWSARRAPC